MTPRLGLASASPALKQWVTAKKKRRSFLRLPIADEYLLRQLISATAQGFLWFSGLLMAVVVISSARKVVAEGLPMSLLFVLVSFEVPRIVYFTLPMSLLYAIVHVFSELSSKGELTALQVAGASLPRLMRAPFLWALCLTLLSYALQEWAVPQAQAHKDLGLLDAVRRDATVQRDLRYEDPPPGGGPLKHIIQARTFNLKTGALTFPRFQFYDDDGRVSLELVAKRGTWDTQTNRWQLFDGESVLRPENRAQGASIISQFGQLEAVAPGPRPLKSQSLNLTLQQHLAHGDYEVASLTKMLRFRRQFIRDLHSRHVPVSAKQKQFLSSVTFGIHDKIATPLLCFALVLAGVPLGVRRQRTAGGFALGISLCVLLLYYAVWTWASTMGESGYANPVLMAYLALISVTVVGAILLRKKMKAS